MDFLLKVSEGKYIDEMYENEYLYFNSFSTFRAREKDVAGRNDPREGNTKISQVQFLEITDSNTGKKYKLHEMLAHFSAQYNEHPTELPNNICSLYTLRFDEDLRYEKIDDRIINLGDKAILIFRIGRLFEILDSTLDDQGIPYSRKPVIYYDYKNLEGNLTFHHKDMHFHFQKEYRIILSTSGKEPMKIKIPGLKEISAVVNTKDLNALELKWDEINGLQ